jgi:hypothetical protein
MGPPRALSLVALRLKGAQVARPVYQIPILLTAIRAIFANQRYTDRSKGASLRRCVSRHGKGQV